MEIQKKYILDENTVKIQCPKCGKPKIFMTEKFKIRGKPYKMRCTCQNVFGVSFEFRKAYRMQSCLEGYYTLIPECKKWRRMDIEDISLKGIKFKTLKRNELSIGDSIKVKFTLNNKKQSKIEKEAFIRWIRDKRIGCEFMGDDLYNRSLGFYLMP
jgi:predicted RNA-binding Zn-ribbon protein involved in translation (DUF1610 family)